MKKKLASDQRFLICGLLAILLLFSLPWLYTVIVVKSAIAQGTYPTAETGMIERANAYYENIEKIEIMYAGPNSFDGSQPHVWYVIARIWAESKDCGKPVGYNGKEYETPGGYYLHTKEGWVQISEALFPVYLGVWMEAFDLAGPGSSTPTVDDKDW
jgi:hypothetical protein